MKSNAEYPTLIPVTLTNRSHPLSFAANANFLTPKKFTDFGCVSSAFSAFVIQSNGFEILCAPKHAITSSYPFTLSRTFSAVSFTTSHSSIVSLSPPRDAAASAAYSFLIFSARSERASLVNTRTLSYLSESRTNFAVNNDPILPHPPTMHTDFFFVSSLGGVSLGVSFFFFGVVVSFLGGGCVVVVVVGCCVLFVSSKTALVLSSPSSSSPNRYVTHSPSKEEENDEFVETEGTTTVLRRLGGRGWSTASSSSSVKACFFVSNNNGGER